MKISEMLKQLHSDALLTNADQAELLSKAAALIESNEYANEREAASLRKTAGRFAASQYARKHGVSRLYRLACQLSAIN